MASKNYILYEKWLVKNEYEFKIPNKIVYLCPKRYK